jgi:hypothetical protein
MKHKFVPSAALVLALFLMLGSTALASTTWYVDGVHGNDNNNCKSLLTACKTISHAISLASSGDTITVAPATYMENLTVPISLTINGAPWSTGTPIIDGGGVNTVLTIPNGSSVVQISGVTIRNGFGGGNGGGGISNAGTLTLQNSAVVNNSAAPMNIGGGVLNSGTLTITSSTINGNTAGFGAGIINYGTLTIQKSSITGNIGTYLAFGGGIDNWGTTSISDSTISGNTGSYGAGILNYYTSANLMLTNSTISGNGPSDGILNSGVTVQIKNSTISGNGSGTGGSGKTMVSNSIIANNSPGGNCDPFSSITSYGYNLSSDGTCPFNNTGDLNNTDPMLGPLQYNGGPTQTQALLTGSPAIDAGNPGPNDGKGTHCPPKDQRGHKRVDRCDMGAYEYP